jgi:hypothetical protein
MARERTRRRKPVPERDVDVEEGAGQDARGAQEPGPEPEPDVRDIPVRRSMKVGELIDHVVDGAKQKLAENRKDPRPAQGMGMEAAQDPVARAERRAKDANAQVATYSMEEIRRDELTRYDRHLVRQSMDQLHRQIADVGEQASLDRTARYRAENQLEDLQARVKELGARLLDRDETIAHLRKHNATMMETIRRSKAARAARAVTRSRRNRRR